MNPGHFVMASLHDQQLQSIVVVLNFTRPQTCTRAAEQFPGSHASQQVSARGKGCSCPLIIYFYGYTKYPHAEVCTAGEVDLGRRCISGLILAYEAHQHILTFYLLLLSTS
jgi:hypothetical protein